MKTDKEYPATHSMSTSWYMVDADGNIGIMEFDDNGPVPKGVTVETYDRAADMVFGQGFTQDGTCKGIHLTEDQIHELLGQPVLQNNVASWSDVCLAIDPDRVNDFLELCKNKDFSIYGCISSDLNLYYVDAFDCLDDNWEIIKDSTLDKILKAGMIKGIYNVPRLEMDSEYDGKTDTVKFTKDFDNSPFYLYKQAYWTNYLQHRMNIPVNPVNVSQIDNELHDKLLHVPFRFKDTEDMQIAQWFVCSSHADVIVIDNAGYSLFPVDKQDERYCLVDPFLFDFYDYCPDMGYYKCKKCNLDCASTTRYVNTLTPTVLYIASPAADSNLYDLLNLPPEIKIRLAIFSYIAKFPHKVPGSWIYEIDRVKKYMTEEALSSLLSFSRGWFEEVVRTINPQVIVIDDEALSVFSSVFLVADNKVLINNTSYPILKASSVNDNQERIIALANAPYRGKIFPMTYTKQEVENLKGEGRVSKYVE